MGVQSAAPSTYTSTSGAAPHYVAADFDFELPPELIAQQPAAARDQARLLVLTEGEIRHRVFADLPELLVETVGPGALLVLNDTRVLPARLRARKLRSGAEGEGLGGQVELLLCEPVADPDLAPDAPAARQRWRCLSRASKPLRPGAYLQLLAPDRSPVARAQVVAVEGGGYVVVDFAAATAEDLLTLLAQIGEVPLPPYIHRSPGAAAADVTADRERYQTVYARAPGSVAAPTAGLHFTPQVLAALSARGIRTASVTLHVGPGTFLPIRTGSSGNLAEHVMHAERYHVPDATAAAIAEAKAQGRKVLAVGTTVVRTLESATAPGERAPRPGWGSTQLFIYPRGPGQPQHRFRVVDALLTNFHLPRSTLLMLIAAFAGRRRVLSAYAEAVAQRYRFFSFGDSMLIPAQLPDPECAPPAPAPEETP
jgi:S-adenosylmethionine:tRNA ribosyltransferase-isomerase